MRKTILLVAVAGLLVAAFPPTHAAGATTISGSYLIGSPVDYAASDACDTGGAPRDSRTSSCVEIPSTLRAGMTFVLTADDALGTIEDAQVCFYTPRGFDSCPGATGFIPEGVSRLSVSSIGGVQVTWTIDFA